jgi:hypothetical protein
MPDLKSELEKVINAWEQPTQPEIKMATTTNPTNSHIVTLFEYIKANPGKTAAELEQAMPSIHRSSVSSVLSSMLKRHLLRKIGGVGKKQFNGTFEVCVEAYMTPAEQLGLGKGKWLSTKAKRKYTKRAKQAEHTIPEVVEAQQVEPVVMPEPVFKPFPAPAPVININDLDVESLTIGQARALRDKLNALFGA